MTKSSIPGDKLYDIWWLVSQLFFSLNELRNRELKKYRITGWQSSVLFLVKLFGEYATPSNLSYWTLRKPHSISELLSRMEKQGFVTRVKDLDNKSSVRIALTDKGEEAYKLAANRTSIHRVLDYLNEEESEGLIVKLKEMRNNAYAELGISSQIPFP